MVGQGEVNGKEAQEKGMCSQGLSWICGLCVGINGVCDECFLGGLGCGDKGGEFHSQGGLCCILVQAVPQLEVSVRLDVPGRVG